MAEDHPHIGGQAAQAGTSGDFEKTDWFFRSLKNLPNLRKIKKIFSEKKDRKESKGAIRLYTVHVAWTCNL